LGAGHPCRIAYGGELALQDSTFGRRNVVRAHPWRIADHEAEPGWGDVGEVGTKGEREAGASRDGAPPRLQRPRLAPQLLEPSALVARLSAPGPEEIRSTGAGHEVTPSRGQR